MEKVHRIRFCDVENDWDSALPIGNGKAGAMVFLKNRILHIAMNHYDCYYRAGSLFQDPARFSAKYEDLCRTVDEARKCEGYERLHYGRILHPGNQAGRPSYKGSSYPVGGELLLFIDDAVDLSCSSLSLNIEEAVITFEAGSGNKKIEAKIYEASDCDCVMLELSQSSKGLWNDMDMVLASGVGQGSRETKKIKEKNSIFLRTAFAKEQENAFLQDSVFAMQEEGDKIHAAAAVLPGKDDMEAVIDRMQKITAESEAHRNVHRAHWKKFRVSSVKLPDEFLETVWHMQLYLMACASGKGSAYPEHACGLSGLWDIRRPNMWGSMWYWDVNIQSAFWGMAPAGHPELLKQFCGGYLQYTDDIHAYTERVYGRKGWALDYPHTLYNCIQPWCAQFLWAYYEYTGDREFLEKKAYPVFREQIEFWKFLAVKDEQGIYHAEYDISPEQGPVTRDSVITISCIRKLLYMGLASAQVLERPETEQQEMRELLQHLPEYTVTSDGKRYRDSAMAQDNLYLRHPSMLMPLFPAGEVSMRERNTLWEEALRYAAENTEVGTFGMGWLSCAAAALGRGTSALRLLYEKGIDFVIHENGLAYEESERFLNYCHLTKPAHFLPVMMESAGGIVQAVTMLLLQQQDGAVRVFPALPGEKEDILPKAVQYHEDDFVLEGVYERWENVSFDGLLAPGGFRIDAERRDGRTVFLKIESERKETLHLWLPAEFSENGKEMLFEKDMEAGEVLYWGKHEKELLSEGTESSGVSVHKAARTHRRVSVGADRHTAFRKAVDGFTCAYGWGNELRYCQTPYVFDFGNTELEKNYDDAYDRQIVMSGRCILYTGGPRQVGRMEYSGNLGYGFVLINPENVRPVDRKAPDDLRRDFLEGTESAEFRLLLPKGNYELLLISGDETEVSHTRFLLPEHGTTVDTGLLKPGSYACKILPAVLEEDGILRLHIEAEPENKWKLNAIFVNKQSSL